MGYYIYLSVITTKSTHKNKDFSCALVLDMFFLGCFCHCTMQLYFELLLSLCAFYVLFKSHNPKSHSAEGLLSVEQH